MSISMSTLNSEISRAHRRIDEISSSVGKSVTVVWTGEGNASVNIPNINNYSAVLFIGRGYGKWGDMRGSIVVPVSYLKSQKSITHLAAWDCNVNMRYNSDTNISVSTGYNSAPVCLALIK